MPDFPSLLRACADLIDDVRERSAFGRHEPLLYDEGAVSPLDRRRSIHDQLDELAGLGAKPRFEDDEFFEDDEDFFEDDEGFDDEGFCSAEDLCGSCPDAAFDGFDTFGETFDDEFDDENDDDWRRWYREHRTDAGVVPAAIVRACLDDVREAGVLHSVALLEIARKWGFGSRI